MKRFTLILLAALMSLGLWAKPAITRVEPLSWWTNMHTPLTLLFHGEDLQDATVTVERMEGKKARPTTGLAVKGQHNAESANYLFVDMDVREAGTYRITLSKGKQKATYQYVISERRSDSRMRQSFTTADVIYLIMSDRFIDGNPNNNTLPGMLEKADKANVHGRFGGDIAGIVQGMEHIKSLGATTIWPTPLLEDNEAAWSYHGYACSDYYHIDPRYGSNEEYRQMVATAHSKGLKIVMDMVPNHCGAAHWWMKDLPYHDWINQFPTFTNTSNVFSANYDINASMYDRQLSNRGWFDTPMPDMNLMNPDLLKYFQQWAIWWIEYADLDGLRVDTYPYIEKIPGSQWLKAIRDEYPNINIVGECWTRPASAVAYWQSGTRNFDGFDSNLPTVMDFPLEEAIRQALENDGKNWGEGLTRVYDALAQDYLYGDPNKLLLFVGNHDMDRFADIVKDQNPHRVMLGNVLIATLRGIPQIFAGDEYGMRSTDRSLGHSTLRRPLPLNNLTEEEEAMYREQKALWRWRLGEKVIHEGRTMHFLTRDNTYAFFRYSDDEAVFVYLNASEEERTIPTDHYREILKRYDARGVMPLTGEEIDMQRRDIVVKPLSYLIVKLHTDASIGR